MYQEGSSQHKEFIIKMLFVCLYMKLLHVSAPKGHYKARMCEKSMVNTHFFECT